MSNIYIYIAIIIRETCIEVGNIGYAIPGR